MSDQEKPKDGNLVATGRGDLARVAAANSLVSRGLADLAQGRLLGEKDQSPMEKAMVCFLLGMIDEAIQLFDESIRLHPDHSCAYLLRGEAWLRKNQACSDNQYCDNAIRDFSEAIRSEPEYTSAYEKRGVAWYLKKDFDKAIKDFDEVIRLLPAEEGENSDDEENKTFEAARISSLAEMHFFRGKAWAGRGAHENAINDYDEAIRLDPKNAFAYYSRGKVRREMGGSFADAIRDLDEAIRLSPENSGWYLLRGEIHEDRGDRDKALNDFDKVLRLDRRQRTLPVPRNLEINIPGVLSVMFMGRNVALAETPGLIEISPTMLSEAHDRLLSGKGRLEKLRDLNAPEVIIQNEIQMLKRFEDVWKSAGDKPEDYAYEFKANEEPFEVAEFENAVIQLSALTQLEQLDLTGCSITDNGLAQLRYLSNLRALFLQNCLEITDDGLAHLAALNHLEWLALTGCSVTDRGLAFLFVLKNLQVLDLAGCEKITQDGVKALKAALPRCHISSADG